MLSLAFAGPVPTETGKIALSFTHAIHVVSSWGVLFWSCGTCLSDMGRFEFVMGRFAAAHGAQASARWRSGERQAAASWILRGQTLLAVLEILSGQAAILRDMVSLEFRGDTPFGKLG